MTEIEQTSIELQPVIDQGTREVEESEIPEFHWDDPADEQHASEILNELFALFFGQEIETTKITAAAIEIVGVQWKLTQFLAYLDTAEESLLNYHRVKRFVIVIRNVFLRSERYAGRIFHGLRSADRLATVSGNASRVDLILAVYDFLSEVLSKYDQVTRDWTEWEEEKEQSRIEQNRPPPYRENQTQENQENNSQENNQSPRNSPPPYSSDSSRSRVSSVSSNMSNNANLTEAIQRLNQQLNQQQTANQQNAQDANRINQEHQLTMQQLLQTQQAVADQMRNLTTSIQNMNTENFANNQGNGGSNNNNGNPENFSLGLSSQQQQGRSRSQSDPARLMEQSLQVSTDTHYAKQSLIEVLNKLSQALVKMDKLAENSVLVFMVSLLEKNVLSVQSNIAKFIPDLVQKLSDYIAHEQINQVTSSVFPVRVSQWISDAIMMAPQPFRGSARGGGGAATQISAATGNSSHQKICARFNELGYCDWVGNNGAACKFQHICSNCHGNHGFKNCPTNSTNQSQRNPGFRNALQQNIGQSAAAAFNGMGFQPRFQSPLNNQFSNYQQQGNSNPGFRL